MRLYIVLTLRSAHVSMVYNLYVRIAYKNHALSLCPQCKIQVFIVKKVEFVKQTHVLKNLGVVETCRCPWKTDYPYFIVLEPGQANHIEFYALRRTISNTMRRRWLMRVQRSTYPNLSCLRLA